ncbi:MAG: penicillin-binding protein, partial [Bacteroidales bacterium]|nr:penicillin-binding protein [Bacteroidales bacterium]
MSEDLLKILDDDTPYHAPMGGDHDNNGKDSGRDEYGKTPRRRRLNRLIIKTMWVTFTVITVITLGFFVLSYNNIIGNMPDIDDLKNPIDQYATVIYSADGEEMGRFYNSRSNRMYADYEDIAPCLVDALIATEDSRFTEHSGLDVRALLRVAFKTGMQGDKSSGGGSTITQQLAKLLYTDEPARGTMARARQKLDEWVMAVKLERFYSKEEIIKLYLNQFDFLYNAKGIRSAANIYFSKEAKDLELHEAAMLVGMLKNPSYYNPVINPTNAMERRNVVFDQMVKAKKITQAQADSLKQLPLGINFHRIDHRTGIAPYFREELRRILTAKFPVRSNYHAWEQQKFVD